MVSKLSFNGKIKMNNKFFLNLLSFVLVGLILLFLLRNLINNWQQVRGYRYQFNILYLFLSSIFYFFSIFILTQIWREILVKLKCSIPRQKSFKIVFLSLFGRYIPGKVWLYLFRFQFLRKENVSKKLFLSAAIFESGLSTIAGFLLALILAGKYFFGTIYFFPILFFIIFGIVFLHPKIFYPILNFGLGKIKKETIPLEFQLKFKDLLYILFFYAIYWAIFGLAFYLFVNSIILVKISQIIFLISIFLISVNIGVISLFAPSGVGVREGVLVYFLNYFLPTGISILISFLARIWTIVSEIVLFLIFTVFLKINKKAWI